MPLPDQGARAGAAVVNPGRTRRRPARHRAWSVLVGCCLLYAAAVGVIGNTAGVYLVPVTEDPGWPLSALNRYLSLAAAAMTLSLPLAERVLRGPRMHLVLAAVLTVACGTYAVSATFTSLTQWYVAGVVLGVCFAHLFYLPVPLLVRAWFTRRTGFALGAALACGSVVAAVANPVASALVEAWGWQQTRAIMGAVAWVLAVPAVLLLVRRSPADLGLEPYGGPAPAEAPPPADAQPGPVAARRRVPSIAVVGLMSGLLVVGSSMLQQIPSAAAASGSGLQAGAWGVSAVMVGGVLGKLGLGALRDRWGAAAATGACGLLGALGPALVLIGGSDLRVFLAGCLLLGLGYAGLTVVPPLAVAVVVPAERFSRSYGRVTVVLAAGSVVAPVLYGTLIGTDAGAPWAWVVCLACFAAVLGLSVVLRRPR
ncbi:MFS transporter [Cellulomonas hominis]|uniref:MFS transporter n=1 Tax=Cellulomonas hominis TaxID=156981 RepID=UPI001C11879F|nr:MFS transporter [Cellulomonas hominis]MBU5421212.1 MFS transporter [Cellulomonas hominis]